MGATAIRTAGERTATSRAQLLRTWMKRLLIITGLLVVFGIAANYTTTVYLRIALDRPPYDDFFKHLAFAGIGVGIALLAVFIIRSTTPIKRWMRFAIPVSFFISLALVGLLQVPSLGVTVNGATRFLNLGFIVFQPSELLKISLVFYLAMLMCWWRKPPEESSPKRKNWNLPWYSSSLMRAGRPAWPVLPKRCVLVILLALGFTAIQPDLGSTGILLGSGVITLVLAGVDWKHLLVFLGSLVIIGGLVFLVSPDKFDYAQTRLNTWFGSIMTHAENEDSAAYQITQSRGALVEGGMFGRGFLKSDQKMNRLPLSTKDFVFPVIVEELGFVGGMAVIGLFLALAFVGVRLANLSRDPFNRTVIAALGFSLALQAMVNIGTTTGTLPLSGLTLPFFSEGGTSLVVSILAVGLMYALAAGERIQASKEELAEAKAE